MAGSTTALEPTSPSPLVSSISSLSSQQTSHPTVSRIYKHANQLFLTRQVLEALKSLETIVQKPKSHDVSNSNSDDAPAADTNGLPTDNPVAPVATASRAARIRTWTLYFAILNEAVEMGQEAGKDLFGAKQYKELVAKARDDRLWDEVVMNGYNSVEGNVDAEVVANLATLMLSHAPSQKITQQRLETYLSSMNAPDLDVASHLDRSPNGRQKRTNGTSTPQDLNSRLKILEIYTLHVLPRNHEYEYAREFINMSEALDEERKETFLQALQSVQDEKELNSKKEAELQKQREHQLEDARRRDQKAQQAQLANPEAQNIHHTGPPVAKTDSKDWTKDNSKQTPNQRQSAKPTVTNAPATSDGSSKRTTGSVPSQARPHRKDARGQPTPPSRKLSLFLGVMQRGIISISQSLRAHPLMLVRMLAFVIAFFMALSRRDVRDRLLEARNKSWNKLKQTIGMGTKVSYI